MRMRKLGRSDLAVAPLAFGGNVFGWTPTRRRRFALLDAFVDAGFNLIDTADVLFGVGARPRRRRIGDDHRQVAAARAASATRCVIATKVGQAWADAARACRRPTSPRPSRTRCERLQTDVIDLYQSHDDDPATPIAETLGAYRAS